MSDVQVENCDAEICQTHGVCMGTKFCRSVTELEAERDAAVARAEAAEGRLAAVAELQRLCEGGGLAVGGKRFEEGHDAGLAFAAERLQTILQPIHADVFSSHLKEESDASSK